jgi:hypothetical protein
MGRYYEGDIEGKFWFSIQSSNDADYFGVDGVEPNDYLYYHFDETNLPDIKEGIEDCLFKLGKWRKKLDKFFENNNGYNAQMLEKQINLKEEQESYILEWYARLQLGEQILECVEKTGECDFKAEL